MVISIIPLPILLGVGLTIANLRPTGPGVVLVGLATVAAVFLALGLFTLLGLVSGRRTRGRTGAAGFFTAMVAWFFVGLVYQSGSEPVSPWYWVAAITVPLALLLVLPAIGFVIGRRTKRGRLLGRGGALHRTSQR